MYVCVCMWVSFCVLERDDQQRQEPGMLVWNRLELDLLLQG